MKGREGRKRLSGMPQELFLIEKNYRSEIDIRNISTINHGLVFRVNTRTKYLHSELNARNAGFFF